MKITVEYQSKGKTIKVEVECEGSNPNDCTDKINDAVRAMERLYPPDEESKAPEAEDAEAPERR